jgi:hypothetical protein
VSGTCGDVCSLCQSGSCGSPGNESFDGEGACGSDAYGPILCYTVMWTCLP